MSIKEIHSPEVRPQILSDQSIVYNVHVTYEDTSLIFACTSKHQAFKLRDCLNNTSWVEVQNHQLTN